MGPRPLALALGLALELVAGCARRRAENPCARLAPSLIEVRSQDGVLSIALHAVPAPAGAGGAPATPVLVVCDGENRPLGTLWGSGSPPVLQLKNLAGDVEAQITTGRPTGSAPSGEAVLRYGGLALRLHESDGLLRLLDESGVPVAQIGAEATRAIAYNPGGLPLAAASLVERTPGAPDRRMIARPDGSVTLVVSGLASDRAAAAFALPGIPLAPRMLLARWLDR